MTASLRALLAGLVDYAGLFPPARLPLDEAIRNYARYRQGPDAWMLGRFICPAARLGELGAYRVLFQDGPPLAVSALGRGGDSAEEFLAGLRADLADITAFRERHGDRVTVDVLELRLPGKALAPDPASLGQLLPEVVGLLRPTGLSLFNEFPPGLDRGLLSYLLVRFNTQLGRPAGLKLRCGGLEASAFPPAQRVALALWTCADFRVPFKATAGLHHPFPHFDPGLRATMHGFVNLFAAGVFAHAHGLDTERIQAVLTDNDPAHFRFDDSGLRWGDRYVPTPDIAAARRDAVLSFGSCSFDEPRDDLRALGWL
jgi:hypothetical protein